MTIFISPEIFELLENSNHAEFRVSGMEYRVKSKSDQVPLSYFVKAISGYAENDLSKLLPLWQIVRNQREREKAESKKAFAIGIGGIAFFIALLIAFSYFGVTYLERQDAQAPTFQPIPTNSNVPLPSTSPQKIKRKN